jgi:hypothetical protein
MRFWMDTFAHSALERGQATFAITCYDCTAALAVVTGAEAAALSIIALARPAVAAGTRVGFDAALRRLADATGTPNSTQLDHATHRHLIHGAIPVQIGSVPGRQISTQPRSRRCAPKRGDQLLVHPGLLSKLSSRLRPATKTTPTPRQQSSTSTDPELVTALPGKRANYRNLRRRHGLALSLHERCPEA